MALREVISEAMEAISYEYGIAAEDRELFVSDMANIALNDPAVLQMFDAKLVGEGERFKSLSSRARGVSQIVGTGVPSGVISGVTMPVFSRERDTRVKININTLVSESFKEFLTLQYANDAIIQYRDKQYVDHAEMEVSRRVETDVVMAMLRAEGADALRRPSNGYDFSIIDSGGNWRSHVIREHHGVHSDSPILDKRDQSRDIRRTMAICEEVEEVACQVRSIDCKKTAPFMMSIHANYFIRHEEICRTMAKRGVMTYIGTMFLPEVIRDFDGYFEDRMYNYVIEEAHETGRKAHVLPPAMRKGVGKYVMPDYRRYVRYRFIGGEARHYVHELDILHEYLDAHTVRVIADGGEYVYDYAIIRRVGSLAYFSFKLRDESVNAHEVEMSYPIEESQDGFEIELNANLVRPVVIDIGQKVKVFSPRYVFTPVASYALTQIPNERWNPAQAIGYARSVVSGATFNGQLVQASDEVSSNEVLIATGLAAFNWAFDRMKLIQARLGDVHMDAVMEKVEAALNVYLGNTVDIGQVFSKLKKAASAVFVEQLSRMALRHVTSADTLLSLFESLSRAHTVGGIRVVDLALQYPHLREAKRKVVIEQVVIRVRMPEYDTIEPANPTYLVGEEASYEETLVEVPEVVEQKQVVGDWINRVMAQESEASETSKALYVRLIDPVLRTIPDRVKLRQDLKPPVVVLEYEHGVLCIIEVSGVRYVSGTENFQRYLDTYKGQRVVYAERLNGKVQYGTAVIRSGGVLYSDKRARTDGSFHAFINFSLEVQNAETLGALREKVQSVNTSVELRDSLENGVAGCGKTTSQVELFVQLTTAGFSVLLVAAKRTAADELRERLVSKGYVDPDVYTVDGFLMNSDRWKEYNYVIVDEALTCHGGQIYALKMITDAKVTAYGDTKQGAYFSVARFYESHVELKYPWYTISRTWGSYRTPQDFERILQNDALYGSQYYTMSKVRRSIVTAVVVPGFEAHLSTRLLYRLMGMAKTEKLHVLVYLRREVPQIKPKLSSGVSNVEVLDVESMRVMTLGASQGGDFDNVVVLRLSNQENPLYNDVAQTILACTRHKKRWAYITVGSVNPSLLERCIGSLSEAASLQTVHNRLMDVEV
jgi:hypothetical protein